MNLIKNMAAEIKKYPSVIAGLILIAFLVFLAAYASITIPYDEAISYGVGETIFGLKAQGMHVLYGLITSIVTKARNDHCS